MRLGIVDFVANPGGGVRFTTALLGALRALYPDLQATILTYGPALFRYRRALEATAQGDTIPLLRIRPRRYWRTQPALRLWGIPGTGRLKRWLGYDTSWHYEPPEAAFAGYDVVWFPWIHQHALPRRRDMPIVGTFHDAIVFQWPGLLETSTLKEARRHVQDWMASPVRLAVGSKTTREAARALFGVDCRRLTVIPPGWDHLTVRDVVTVPLPPRLHGPYILCAANTSPHKNHETLFRGLAGWGARIPTVLTGHGADLTPSNPRGAALRTLAEGCGLRLGQDLIPLGYVTPETYRALLLHAWALVMPSYLEGGGSFPVMEAVMAGIPVISSDIPVMRELLSRVGADVLWFDPADPQALALCLRQLHEAYDDYLRRARAQVPTLSVPTWRAAAQSYWALFTQ